MFPISLLPSPSSLLRSLFSLLTRSSVRYPCVPTVLCPCAKTEAPSPPPHSLFFSLPSSTSSPLPPLPRSSPFSSHIAHLSWLSYQPTIPSPFSLLSYTSSLLSSLEILGLLCISGCKRLVHAVGCQLCAVGWHCMPLACAVFCVLSALLCLAWPPCISVWGCLQCLCRILLSVHPILYTQPRHPSTDRGHE